MSKKLRNILITNELIEQKVAIKLSSILLTHSSEIFKNINQFTKMLQFVKVSSIEGKKNILFCFFNDFTEDLFREVLSEYDLKDKNYEIIMCNETNFYTKILSKKIKLAVFFGIPSAQLLTLCVKNEIFFVSVNSQKSYFNSCYKLPFNADSIKKILWFVSYFKNL